MRHGPRRHLVAVVAALAAASASLASACSSDPTVGTPGDATSDASAAGDSARPDGAPDVQAATDAPSASDTNAPEADAPLEDVVNPYTDAFETYDAAADTAITPERDTGTTDSGGPHLVDAASD